ncbi:hypothetical protein, partial [Hominenteromicrobium sp.]|uniref:hypothetical protein n=1 Tax=Hominenteromicrobium sp. TaxID=3073581 RepID=UPI003A8E678E
HLIHREIDYENTWYIERKEDGALLGMIAAEEDGVRFDVRSKSLSVCSSLIFSLPFFAVCTYFG